MAVTYLEPNEDVQVDVSGWATSTGSNYYSLIDDGTRSPSTPDTTDYVSGFSSFSYFDDGAMTLGFTTQSIAPATSLRLWVYGQRISGSVTTIDCSEVGVGLGNPTGSLTFSGTAGWTNVDWEAVNLDQSEIDVLSIRFTPQTAPSGQIRVHAMYLELTSPSGGEGDFFPFFA